MDRGKKYIQLITISGIIFYILNYFTPLYSDDWHYNFIYGSLENINSLSDIIKSQYIHYFNVNGRFIPHFIVQLFDGILGKEIFNIFNTIAFILFLHLSTHFVKNEYKASYLPLFLILMLCFFLMPSFNNCFLWMSGACNYLWVADILFLFNLLLFKKLNNSKYYPILLVFGIISGWTNEALVIGLGAGYFLYFIIKKIKPMTSQIWLLCGFYIGTMLLIFSPGSINRALHGNDATFNITIMLHNLMSSLLNMNNIRLLPIFIVILLYLIYKKKIHFKQFIYDNIIWITAIIITFIFILFTRHNSGHSRFGFELFSLLLIIKLLSTLNINKYLILICHSLLLITIIYVIKLSYANNREYQNCMHQIINGSSIILTNEIKCSPYFERLIIRFINSESSETYNSFMNQKWIANRYGKKSLVFIPQSLYTQIVEAPEKFNNQFYTTNDLPFYVMKTEEQIPSAKFILKKTDYKKLPFYLKLIAHKMKKYSINNIICYKINTLKILNSNYIFIGKNNLIKNRVLYININNKNYNVTEIQ